jgi:hypothetical protein
MTLHDTIESDALTVFCNEDDFAESVTYWARGNAVGRTIVAPIMREQATAFDAGGGQTNLPTFQVHVHNNATTGISSAELDTGGDEIEFPPRDGKPTARKAILQLVTQDHGMLVLECR